MIWKKPSQAGNALPDTSLLHHGRGKREAEADAVLATIYCISLLLLQEIKFRQTSLNQIKYSRQIIILADLIPSNLSEPNLTEAKCEAFLQTQ